MGLVATRKGKALPLPLSKAFLPPSISFQEQSTPITPNFFAFSLSSGDSAMFENGERTILLDLMRLVLIYFAFLNFITRIAVHNFGLHVRKLQMKTGINWFVLLFINNHFEGALPIIKSVMAIPVRLERTTICFLHHSRFRRQTLYPN